MIISKVNTLIRTSFQISIENDDYLARHYMDIMRYFLPQSVEESREKLYKLNKKIKTRNK